MKKKKAGNARFPLAPETNSPPVHSWSACYQSGQMRPLSAKPIIVSRRALRSNQLADAALLDTESHESKFFFAPHSAALLLPH